MEEVRARVSRCARCAEQSVGGVPVPRCGASLERGCVKVLDRGHMSACCRSTPLEIQVCRGGRGNDSNSPPPRLARGFAKEQATGPGQQPRPR